MRTVLIIILIFALMPELYAYDFKSGLETGMGETVLLSKPSAYGLLECPGNILLDRQFVVESGWNRKYELADLDCVSLAAAGRFGSFGGAIGFWQMGTPDYYTDKVLRAAFSYYYDSFTASLITSGRIVEIGDGFGTYRAASVGLGAAYRYKNYFFGLTFDDLNGPKIVENADGENIKANLFAEIKGGTRHSVAGRIILEKYEKPIISLGQYIYVHEKNALFWGLSQNPLTYGGGFEAEYKNLSIIYGASYHPVLGFSHNISLKFLFGGKITEE